MRATGMAVHAPYLLFVLCFLACVVNVMLLGLQPTQCGMPPLVHTVCLFANVARLVITVVIGDAPPTCSIGLTWAMGVGAAFQLSVLQFFYATLTLYLNNGAGADPWSATLWKLATGCGAGVFATPPPKSAMLVVLQCAIGGLLVLPLAHCWVFDATLRLGRWTAGMCRTAATVSSYNWTPRADNPVDPRPPADLEPANRSNARAHTSYMVVMDVPFERGTCSLKVITGAFTRCQAEQERRGVPRVVLSQHVLGAIHNVTALLQGRRTPPLLTVVAREPTTDVYCVLTLVVDTCTSRTSGGSADAGCSICLEALSPTDVSRASGCVHVWHTLCLLRWIMSKPFVAATCPVCRAVLN